MMPRDKRPVLKKRFPVHVTLRMRRGLPTLRREPEFAILVRALATSGRRPDFQVVHYSAQHDHIHLICEADDAVALSRGIVGLGVCIARNLNRLWKRRGSVLEDRFHSHILETPLETFNCLLYVFANARKHGHRYSGIDRFSSGSTFPGWKGLTAHAPKDGAVVPRTWLLVEGWKWHGRLDPEATPGPISGKTSPQQAPRVRMPSTPTRSSLGSNALGRVPSVSSTRRLAAPSM